MLTFSQYILINSDLCTVQIMSVVKGRFKGNFDLKKKTKTKKKTDCSFEIGFQPNIVTFFSIYFDNLGNYTDNTCGQTGQRSFPRQFRIPPVVQEVFRRKL